MEKRPSRKSFPIETRIYEQRTKKNFSVRQERSGRVVNDASPSVRRSGRERGINQTRSECVCVVCGAVCCPKIKNINLFFRTSHTIMTVTHPWLFMDMIHGQVSSPGWVSPDRTAPVLRLQDPPVVCGRVGGSDEGGARCCSKHRTTS